jgi:hypothetical protein
MRTWWHLLLAVIGPVLGVGLMASDFACASKKSPEEKALATISDWQTRAFRESASDAEQDWRATNKTIGPVFTELPREDRAGPLWQLSLKYFAEGQYIQSQRLAVEAMKVDGKAPNGFGIYVASLARDTSWLESQAAVSSESPLRVRYLNAAICWSNNDALGVLRMAAPVINSSDRFQPDVLWITFLGARALDAQGDSLAAADYVERILPCTNTMMAGHVDPFRVYLTCMEIYLKAGRRDAASAFMPSLRGAAEKFDVSWAAVRQELALLDEQIDEPK